MKRTSLVPVAAVAAVAALGLAGCSSAAQSASVSGSDQTPATAQAPAGSSGGPGAGSPGRFPGASGLVAAVTGTTAQVQGATQQTAVTWTSTTRFTRQVRAGASAVTVGECVLARPARGTAGSQGGTQSGGTQSGGSTDSIAAANVEIVPSVNGSCLFGGFGGRAGGRPSGAPTATPGAGAGSAGQGRRAFGPVGKVTAVGSGQFTVAPVARPGAMAMAPYTVTYSPSTVFTRLASADASAVKVGVCVSAQGRTDDTGALTATSVAVSSPVGGTCQSGFGGRGFGGRGPGGAATPTGAGNA